MIALDTSVDLSRKFTRVLMIAPDTSGFEFRDAPVPQSLRTKLLNSDKHFKWI